MKKVIAISSVLLGIIFLAGCSQSQPTTPAPAAQQSTANQSVATQPEPTTQTNANTVAEKTPEQIIFDLLGKDKDMIITIDSSTSSHIKANINFNSGPSGYYVLATKINGEWKKVFEGQECNKKDLAGYNFPQNMLTSCY
jgi:PBP1b-binding outer membrane lipoprotein LpoB